jgi:hypothetical protein
MRMLCRSTTSCQTHAKRRINGDGEEWRREGSGWRRERREGSIAVAVAVAVEMERADHLPSLFVAPLLFRIARPDYTKTIGNTIYHPGMIQIQPSRYWYLKERFLDSPL